MNELNGEIWRVAAENETSYGCQRAISRDLLGEYPQPHHDERQIAQAVHQRFKDSVYQQP